MKVIISAYIALGMLILVPAGAGAQDNTEPASVPQRNEAIVATPHSFQIEAGGRTFLFGSLNYEYALHRQFSVGTGLGVISVLSGQIIRDNNGSTETGKYLDISTTQMIYGNYFIGKKRSQLLITAGITNFLATYRNRYPSETVLSAEAQLEWNAGIGYQYSANRFYFRFTAYLLSMPGPSDWFPDYMPWGGITAGWRLK